jgi:hypothetical protein
MPPVFGDFLAQARDHVTAAVSIDDEVPDAAKSGAIRELDRLITTLARYLGDMPLPGEFHHSLPGDDAAEGTRAALDARLALRRSAQILRSAAVQVKRDVRRRHSPGALARGPRR